MVLYSVKIYQLYWFNKLLIGQDLGKKYRQGDQNRRILGRGEGQSVVITQMQRKQDENASLIKYKATWLTQTRILG